MGTNQIGYQVKIKGLDVTSLKELGRLMGPLQMLFTRSLCMVGFAPIPTRHKASMSAPKPSLVCQKEKSRLGPTLGWDRRQNNQMVSSMEGRKGGSSPLMWGLPKHPVDRDEGLY